VKVQELSIDYTNCASASADFLPIPDGDVHSSFKSSNTTSIPKWKQSNQTVTPQFGVQQENTRVCTLQFTLPNDIGAPVYLYYRLTNFYQNHRRYVKSLDLDQLKGNFISASDIDKSSCTPLKLDPNGKPYYPCGLIANSIFNDTINSPSIVSTSGGQSTGNYTMTNKGIAWSSDLKLYKQTQYNNSYAAPPPNWATRFPDGYTDENPIPDLSTYEEFAVWMRTAGLPTFSKLALRNDQDVMKAGTYQMDIYDCMLVPFSRGRSLTMSVFPVKLYGGTKSILISTRTVMGGKNNFLGIAYLVIGGLCILLGAFFTVANLFRPRFVSQHSLVWDHYLTTTENSVTIPIFHGTMTHLHQEQQPVEILEDKYVTTDVR